MTIFLKDARGAVIGTVSLTQRPSDLAVKLNHKAAGGGKKLMLALEGDMLPLSLFEIEGAAATLRAQGRLGSDVSSLLFYRTPSSSEFVAYGFAGKGGIKPESILERANKRLFGTKIVEPSRAAEQPWQQVEPPKTKEEKWQQPKEAVKGERESLPQERPAREDLKSFHESMAKSYEEIEDDPYMREDTTLSDIDLIAEENYYKMEKPQRAPWQRVPIEDARTDDTGENGCGKADFYQRIKDKLQRLFEENERDEALCNLIPQSHFVKIYYDRDKYYSVGIVRENGEPSYLCYSVPQEQAGEPPEEFEGLCRWFPKDLENPGGAGYWILFQSLSDGSYIRVL